MANSINRLQIILRDGKAFIDYTIINDEGKQVLDGTVDNFSSSNIQPLLTEAENKVKEMFGIA